MPRPDALRRDPTPPVRSAEGLRRAADDAQAVAGRICADPARLVAIGPVALAEQRP